MILLPRTGMLAQMEGGTRKEFRLAELLALSINLVAAGAAFMFVTQIGWGVGIGLLGLVGVIIFPRMIYKYVLSRATIFGPWPKDHNIDDPRE